MTTHQADEVRGLTPAEAFQEVNALLIEFPELHYQGRWESDDTFHRCGTTRCVAGWAVWAQARRLGLLTRKRDLTNASIRRAVARSVGVDLYDDAAFFPGDLYFSRVGGVILGLSPDDASGLFMDMNSKRVVARVASYAATGKDISTEEFRALGDGTDD